MTTDTQIQADIEELRNRVSDTPSLYREVCAVLFFRYGITPTANKLYQYVRKGSMSAPAEALTKFWADLREKSRVRIEYPDLPDELKLAAGDLVGNLWTQAQSAAQESLAIFRSEAKMAVAEADAAKAAMSEKWSVAQVELARSQEALGHAAERTLQLERELAAERAEKEGLSLQLSNAGLQRTTLEAALAEARHDFASELDKLRNTAQRAEERFEAERKRALLEIDRERSAAGKLQKDLLQVRQHQADADKRHREEIASMQLALGEARQKLGASEGGLQEVRALNEQQAQELQSRRIKESDLAAHYAVLQRELEAAQNKLRELKREPAQQIKASTAPGTVKPRQRRKPSPDATP